MTWRGRQTWTQLLEGGFTTSGYPPGRCQAEWLLEGAERETAAVTAAGRYKLAAAAKRGLPCRCAGVARCAAQAALAETVLATTRVLYAAKRAAEAQPALVPA